MLNKQSAYFPPQSESPFGTSNKVRTVSLIYFPRLHFHLKNFLTLTKLDGERI